MTDTALVPAGRGPATPANRQGQPARTPTSIEKAAMILTAIGPDLAATFLRSLDEAEMERFARAIAGLGRIDQAMMDQVIGEFLDLLTSGPEVSGGSSAARRLLSAVISDEAEIDRLVDGRRKSDSRPVWERLSEVPVMPLAGFVQAEHPQTAAVIISELKPETAAAVLERLDRRFAQEIVLRLSRVPSLDHHTSIAVQSAIERDFLSVLQRNLSKRRPVDLIAGLLNNISTEVREGFMGYLEAQDATLAADVQRTMFTFEDIATRLAGRDVAGVLRDVPEEVLLQALKLGQAHDSPTVRFLLDNLPRRLADRYIEELGALADVGRKDGEAAQIEITKVIQAQVKSGAIRLLDKDAG